MNLEEIKEVVKGILSEKRYEHSVCVMNMCEKLAIKYGVDVNEAKLVGITHDIAKEMTKDEIFKFVSENNIQINDIEKKIPTLLHGIIGAKQCKEKFNFPDKLVKAIEAHTTGKAQMDSLAKVLYVADAISEDRTGDYLEKARELANEDLDKAMLFLLNEFLGEKIKKGEIIHPDGIIARNTLLMEKN